MFIYVCICVYVCVYEVIIVLHKSHWNEKEKIHPYDQDDIFFLDKKSILIFFISSHPSRLKSNVLLV